jgi:hypothetical protein
MSEQPLDAVQRWMQAVIMHPDGVSAGIASEAAREAIDVAPGDIEHVVERSRALSSVERLAVYANAYHARLVECLRAEFPILAQTLGEDAFSGFAFEYLQSYPSRSYTLARLGEHFARHLEETRPPRDPKPVSGGDPDAPDWADFLIDLARLEWTFSQVFDGPGVEGQPLLDADRLRAIPPEQWVDARLTCVPCLRVETFRFPVSEYFTAIRRGEQPAPPAPAPTFLAINRRAFIVRRHELTREQHMLLSSLLSGATVGEAIERAAPNDEAALPAFADRLRTWFARWSAEGFFLDVVVPG